MAQFVVQEHKRQNEKRHWDLMWEQGDVLKTYRLDRSPQEILRQPAIASPIFDHDKRFLTYEGPVNQNLGRVRIRDTGMVDIVSTGKSHWDLTFDGRILKGRFYLKQREDHVWEFGLSPLGNK